MMKKLRILAALTILTTVSGCATMQPWVKPYERQALADEIMLTSRHANSMAFLKHVHESREGARGATGSGGGGCGCN